ncbi:RidA family protein [Spirosoma oryzicola]|uniref:RidA family protein n=1 Tax=Spirosoma oryzicola TaxID=2898794 RepID=UPI001E38AC2E|nr:Rid family detoxifying hydrolase [Spirosoma oryzicola]UHG91282.1 Rid family detoxifying hydrolase [Spirosoma oryzicola]
MTFIETPNAPKPGGHYSQAVVHGDLVFISGILPITPSGEKLTEATVLEQMQQVLKNLDAILEAAGSTREKVLKVTVFIADMEAWGPVNQLYTHFFGDHRPARSIVPVLPLHYGFGIELEAVAIV